MRIVVKIGSLCLVAVLTAAALAACGSSAGQDASGAGSGSTTGGSSAGGGAPIAVVTSTSVWGDIVKQIGGDQVSVASLISDPAADPHSFEPNAQAQLALSKAALVVGNGGGYDAFLQQMLQAAGGTAPVIDAVAVSGFDTGQAGLNEHVWYDFPTAVKVAGRIAIELSTIRPEQAALFTANLTAFTGKVAALTAKLDVIKAAHGGTPVAITEPVPRYLIDAAGLVNVTPAEFSAAIEEGTDVPPAVLADTLALFTGRKVAVLVYNMQTSSPETEQLLAAAKDNGIAVVGVGETLPEGEDYVSWMDSNLTALVGALRG